MKWRQHVPGVGESTSAQVQYAMLDFFFSNNPQAPGNHFLSPLG